MSESLQPSGLPWGMAGTRTHRAAGVTILELLVAIAVAAVLITTAVLSLRPPSATLFAGELRALLLQARLEAVKRNALVAVVYDAADPGFVTRLDDGDGACTSTLTLANRRASAHRSVTISTELADGDGLVWLPSGLARACDGGALTPTIAVLDDGVTLRSVSITATGRVVVE
jgi:Tfp pilus assembly protein FimT